MGTDQKDLTEKWETAKKSYPEIKGNEKIIEEKWDQLEASSLLFIYTLIK